MQYTLIKPQTTGNTSENFNTAPYRHIVASADGLATTEAVAVNIISGATAKPFMDDAGEAVTLTATVTNVTLPGGPTYQFVKDASAGSCGVYADLSPI